MARIKVPFLGVTSRSNHADGECKNIVNLRPKNGFLKPVPPRKIEQNLTWDYDIIFVHRGNDYEHWIGVRNFDEADSYGVYSMIYADIKNTTPMHVGNTSSLVKSVQQIGNTLAFVTDNDIYYALYINNGYKFLGSMPEIPPITMGVGTTICYDKLFYKNVLGSLWMFADISKREINEAVVNKARKNIIDGTSTSGVAAGVKLFDAHLVRYAFRLYDGRVIKHSPPILVMPNLDILSMNRYLVSYLVQNGSDVQYDDSYVYVRGYDFNMEYDFSSIAQWNDIIKSVDVFTSAPLGVIAPEFFRDNINTGRVEIDLIDELTQKQIDKVAECSLFYHSHTLELKSNSQSFCGSINKSISNINNIIYQELMEDDQFSHHIITSDLSNAMNNRLRLSRIKTKLFNGYPMAFFKWMSDYNGQTRGSIPVSTYTVHVHIKTSSGIYIGETVVDESFFLNSFLAYPDSRAFEINIYTRTGIGPYVLIYTSKLISHPSLNISYAISPLLKPTVRFTNGTPTDYYSFEYGISTFVEYNKIKISEINNPFVFKNEQTYLIGSGEILAESSIIMNVSDRNYGMFPVFVFTTDGVFTMASPKINENSESDIELIHESIQAPTYLEPPISGVICPTPYGVVFITKRGLMLINGDGTAALSQILREDDDILNIDLVGIESPLISFPSISFTSFLNAVTNMVYNPYHDELIIAAKTMPYCYVYDFPSKSFYLSTEKIDQVVQNTFPDVYVVGGASLKDMSDYEDVSAEISIITRPIQFGTTDIKKMERIFLRALMYNAQGVSVAAYHSVDGVHFDPIKGFTFGAGENYKDFDLGLLARETYRQYIFLLTGTMDDESQIEYVDYEVDKNYNTEKMR